MTQIIAFERSHHNTTIHLLDRISCWRDEDRGSLFLSGGHGAIDFCSRYKRPYAVMDRNNARRSFSDREQTTFDRLRPCSPARHNFREFSDLELTSQREKPSRLLRWENDDHFLDTFTQFKGLECAKNNRNSCQLQKLFRPITRHPAATDSGGNNRNIHERETEDGKTLRLTPAYLTVLTSALSNRLAV